MNIISFYWQPPSGSSSGLPEDVAVTLDAWRTTHPDFSVRVWSFDEVCSLVQHHGRDDIVAAMKASVYPAMVSDIARVAIMNFVGGVYSDLKNFPVTPFLSDFIRYEKPVVTQHPPTIANYERFICNAFFCGPPGHKFFSELLNLIVKNVIDRKKSGIRDVTGGGPLMSVLGSPFRDDVIVKSSAEVWGDPKSGKLMKRVKASYNGVNMENHWSKQQRISGIYRDS